MGIFLVYELVASADDTVTSHFGSLFQQSLSVCNNHTIISGRSGVFLLSFCLSARRRAPLTALASHGHGSLAFCDERVYTVKNGHGSLAFSVERICTTTGTAP